jgi:hypothetical protein
MISLMKRFSFLALAALIATISTFAPVPAKAGEGCPYIQGCVLVHVVVVNGPNGATYTCEYTCNSGPKQGAPQ